MTNPPLRRISINSLHLVAGTSGIVSFNEALRIIRENQRRFKGNELWAACVADLLTLKKARLK